MSMLAARSLVRFSLTLGKRQLFSYISIKTPDALHSEQRSDEVLQQIRGLASFSPADSVNFYPNKIGNREVVGYGKNGKPEYVDSVTFPYPAVRFREINADFKALKEKEKGSWRMLTKTEKKCLYRISFCQTLAEVTAPSGEWKLIIGSALMVVSAGIWLYLLVNFMVRSELPETFEPERQVEQLKRMIDLRMNPIDGISSNWDYENNNWKGLPSKNPKKKEKKRHDDDDDD